MRQRSAACRAPAQGQGLDALPAARVDEVLKAYPRLGFKADAVQTMVAYC